MPAMQIHTTCRHTKLTPAIQRHLEERLAKLERFATIREAHVVLETEKYRQIVEIQLKSRDREIVSKEEARDMIASIDLAADRLERQLKKLKEKRSTQIRHDGTRANGDETRGAVRSAARAALGDEVIAPPAPTGRKTARRAQALAKIETADDETELPRVVPAKPHPRPLSVEDAALLLSSNGAEFLAFVNAETEELNVLYRRKDGDLGLIEGGLHRRSRG
jgi:putative sigma-54 modulation protein